MRSDWMSCYLNYHTPIKPSALQWLNFSSTIGHRNLCFRVRIRTMSEGDVRNGRAEVLPYSQVEGG